MIVYAIARNLATKDNWEYLDEDREHRSERWHHKPSIDKCYLSRENADAAFDRISAHEYGRNYKLFIVRFDSIALLSSPVIIREAVCLPGSPSTQIPKNA